MDPEGPARLDFSAVRLRGYWEWPYQQIAAVMRQAVAGGALRPGDRLPSEKELMDATGASRWAVRHAVEVLRDEGLVITVPHLGSFIAPAPGAETGPGGKRPGR